MKQLSLSIIIILSSFTSKAINIEGLYFTGKAGYHFPSVEKSPKNIADTVGFESRNKRTKTASLEAALGYEVAPAMRTEIAYHKPLQSKTTVKQNSELFTLNRENNQELFTSNNIPEADNISFDISKASFKSQVSINSVFVKSYYDMPISDGYSAFVGGGIGYAQINMKTIGGSEVATKAAGADVASGTLYIADKNSSKKGNLAFAATFGAAMDINEKAKIYADYTYSYYGKTKKMTPKLKINHSNIEEGQEETLNNIPSEITVGKFGGKKVDAHTFSIGFRFNL